MANPFKVGDKVRRKKEELGAFFREGEVYIVEHVSASGVFIRNERYEKNRISGWNCDYFELVEDNSTVELINNRFKKYGV